VQVFSVDSQRFRENLHDVAISQFNIAENVADLYKEKVHAREVERFRAAHRNIISTYWNQYVSLLANETDVYRVCIRVFAFSESDASGPGDQTASKSARLLPRPRKAHPKEAGQTSRLFGRDAEEGEEQGPIKVQIGT
jgi:hypothetical protein